MINQTYSLRSTSLRDALSIAFRRKRLIIGCLAATVVAAVLAALILPRYHGEAKILVDRDRVDPVLSPTPESNTYAMAAQPMVTDEDIRSEVEMMKSEDVLTQVVKDLHMADPAPATWWTRLTAPLGRQVPYDERVSAQVNKLAHDLVVEPAKGSYIINVVYKSKNRDLAKRVLDKLLQVYMAKHTEVHHPAGQYAFFEQQVSEYRKKMEAAQAKLAAFPETADGSVAPGMDRELTMQKLAEFRFSLNETRAEIADTNQRIQRLQQAEKATPDRITTQVKKSDNPQLLEQLKSTLLTLELKRSDLLSKYQPDYRPVQELTEQITQTRAAIQHELSSPMGDVTTDVDPTHQMIRSDLAKAQTDLAGYKAREAATQGIVDNYTARARDLDESALQQADLQMEFKAEQDNYLLYLRKSEEARISDALDAHRMVNVTVAEPPFVPALPSHSPTFFAGLATIAMLTLSFGLIWGLERMDRTFHTPRELEAYLGIPVLVAIPRQVEGALPLRPLYAGSHRGLTWTAEDISTPEPLNGRDGSDKGDL